MSFESQQTGLHDMPAPSLEFLVIFGIALACIAVWSVSFLVLPYRRHRQLGRELERQGIHRVDRCVRLERWFTRWRGERTYLLEPLPSLDLERALAARLDSKKLLRMEHRHTGRIVVYNDLVLQGNINALQAFGFSKRLIEQASIEFSTDRQQIKVHCSVLFDVLARRHTLIILAVGALNLLPALLLGSDAAWQGMRYLYIATICGFYGYFWFGYIVAQFLATGHFFDVLLLETLGAG